MKTTSSPTMLLLASWLILIGLRDVFGIRFDGITLISGLLALGAGVLLLTGK